MNNPPWQIDRVQRLRTRDSKLPSNSLCVTRGRMMTYGNPFKVDDMRALTKHGQRREAVRQFSEWIKQPEQSDLVQKFLRRCRNEHITHLACFCGRYDPCHGDVWIEIWNAQGKE